MRQGTQVETAINRYGDKAVRWSSQGMLRLTLDAMKRLFTPTLEHIKEAIAKVIDNVQGKSARSFEFSVLSHYIHRHVQSLCCALRQVQVRQ